MAVSPKKGQRRLFRPHADEFIDGSSPEHNGKGETRGGPFLANSLPVTQARLPHSALENQPFVRWQNRTRKSIKGTSISTPTTVASAAPEDSPNNIAAVAMATSK